MIKKLFCYHVTTQGRFGFITDQVIRLAPPLIVKQEHVNQALGIFISCIQTLTTS